MSSVLFTGGFVYDVDARRFEKKDVYCENGIIRSFGAPSAMLGGVNVVDITGRYLVPGLVDVHTHGIAGFDFCGADGDEMEKMARAYAKAGTTSLMPTLASAPMPVLYEAIRLITSKRETGTAGASFLGVHLEGRYLNPKKRGAHAIELLALPEAEEVADLIARMSPPPMHFSFAPELAGAREFLQMSNEAGATVGIAHTNATYDQATWAVEMGTRSFTHTFNAMTAVHHREPGCTVASLTCDEAYSEFICDGEHIHPAVIRMAYRAKPKDRFVLVTDSMSATGCPDGKYEIAGTPVTVEQGQARSADGTIAGSTLTLFKAVCNLMRFSGISLEDALPAATSNPAEMIGAKTVGRIEPGCRADFLLLTNVKEPEIASVYVGGSRI